MDIAKKPKFLLYSRWCEQIGELPVLAAHHRQEINGEDRLDLDITQPLAKGDRVLWTDGRRWDEHVVDAESQSHDGGETFSASCVRALQADLSAKQVREWKANVSASAAVAELLKLTAWTAGEVSAAGATATFEFERASVYECLLQVCGAFGLELRQDIEVGEAGVTARRVSLVSRMGGDHGTRFDYGHDLAGISKEVLDTEVCTAVYGYGKDSLWCYVADADALKLWGVPGPDGEPTHAEGVFEDSSVADKAALEAAAKAWLEVHKQPEVTYDARIPFAPLKDVRLGDTVHVVDRDFTPELRLKARVGSLERDILRGEASSATFGTVVSVLPDVLSRAYDASARAMNAVASVNPDAIVEKVDERYAADGATVRMLTLDDKKSAEQAVGALTVDASGALLWNGRKVAIVEEPAS